MNHRLARLFRPQSIAVIGGGSWGENIIRQCRKMDYPGEIFAVHPKREQIGGVICHPTIESLPRAPDAAFIAVNRFAAIEVVEALKQKNVGGAVCFAAGFLESDDEDADGAALQKKLLEAAGEMPVLGPNCYGFINYLDRALLWPDQHGGAPCESGVAIIMQSSNIAINLTMQKRGLPIAYIVTAGNQAQIGIADIGAALLEDERVTALGLYIEGIGDVRAFETLAAQAREMQKPIIALKTGKSAASQIAAVSHTASLAGDDAGASALLARLGIARVSSLTAFLETLKLLHLFGAFTAKRMVSMSCSGGEAGLMADAAETHGLDCPELTDRQKQDLRATFGEMVALANPLDYHTFIWHDEAAMAAVFTAMMSGEADAAFLVLDYPRVDRCDDSDWQPPVNALYQACQATGMRAAVVCNLPENIPESHASALMTRGIVPMMGIEDALTALNAANAIAASWAYELPAPLWLAHSNDATEDRVLDEAHAKQLLSAAGLAVPRSMTAESAAEAAQMAEEIGYPVVLKAVGIAHKTEHQAVRLNLMSADAVSQAGDEMRGITKKYLIEQQVTEIIAELLVGVMRDPAHGFLLNLSAGGILTELMRDTQHLLLPATRDEIASALQKLRIAQLLNGYRGGASANLDAVIDAVEAVCRFVEQHIGNVQEIDINPLLCTAQSAIAADALIRITGEHL